MLTLFSLLCLWVANCKTIAIGDSHTCVVQSNKDTFLFAGAEKRKSQMVGLLWLLFIRCIAAGSNNNTQLAVGANHVCAIQTNGEPYCFGSNVFGQLGDSTNVNRLYPTRVRKSGSPSTKLYAASVCAGNSHTCFVFTDGSVGCTGLNADGQLGINSTVNSNAVRQVLDSTSNSNGIFCGGFHTCVINSTGGMQCFGRNAYGQLSIGSQTNALLPTPIVPLVYLPEASSISSWSVDHGAAGLGHTCVVTTTGGLICGGLNNYNQASRPNSGLSFYVAWNQVAGDDYYIQPIEYVTVTAKVTTGSSFTCQWCISTSVVSQGAVVLNCFGQSSSGQLGGPILSSSLGAVFNNRNFLSLKVLGSGGATNCFVQVYNGTTTSLQCMGSNQFGQFGNGLVADKNGVSSSFNTSNVNISSVGSIQVGWNNTLCVLLKPNNIVFCSGNGLSGQLGNGFTNSSSFPSQVIGLPVTSSPTTSPSRSPSKSPTTSNPSKSPSKSPTTSIPSKSPSKSPVTSIPSKSPSKSSPTTSPSKSPSKSPATSIPSKSPSKSPTTSIPSKTPTHRPTTLVPSNNPVVAPTSSPTNIGCLG